MHTRGITDIDSLCLQVRDRESRRLISEAIAAYRGGALRSAIMSTWIAVAYDIISKARELASQGDGAAKIFVSDLDKAIATPDLPKLQAIERDLLQTANDQFQFFAKDEFDALDRLHDDRNLCAHPAFVTEDRLFQPSLELVRTHIVHALEILLVHAPLQGKRAIARFQADFLSTSFPVFAEDINAYMRSKYLDRAKDALVKNLLEGAITIPFGSERSTFAGHERRIALVLGAISKAKTAIYEETVPSFVRGYFDNIGDELLLRLCTYLEVDPRIWEWLSEAAQIRLKRLIEVRGADELKDFSAFDAFEVPEISELLLARFDEFDVQTQTSIIAQFPKAVFSSRAIEIYGASGGYRIAEARGQSIILPMAPYFDASDIQTLLDRAADNPEIWDATGSPAILEELFDKTIQKLPATHADWKSFAKKVIAHGREKMYGSLQSKIDAMRAPIGNGS